MSTDYLADARFRLGPLCKHGHDYNRTGQSIRYVNGGGCRECAVAAAAVRNQIKRDQPTEHHRQQRREYKRRARERNFAAGLTSRGATPKNRCASMTRLERAIFNAGRCPSVADLVAREQARWSRHASLPPEEKARRIRARFSNAYHARLDLRLYHREKSKRRKASDRGQTPVQISVTAIRARFALFGNCCAYCGISGDMQIEHVVPISQGGAHDAMNIVPACQPCNCSKRANDMEEWYRSQDFFDPARLALIKHHTSDIFSRQLLLDLE